MKPPDFPDKRSSRRAFDRAAARYDDNAAIQQEVGRRLLDHLEGINILPRRIVDLGCGTGAHLDALGRRYPGANVTGVDLSAAMLARARDRAPWWRRIAGGGPTLVRADAERLPLAAASSDFTFSNLALHWCDPQNFFAEASRTLATGGLLLFSTFGPDTLRELRAAFRAVDEAPHVHSFIDMHDLGDALVHAGFGDPVMEMETLTIEYADIAGLARDLRSTGGTNAMGARRRGLMAPARWNRMVERYEAQRRGGALPATCEVVYGHAWKAAPRKLADGRQVIDFPQRGAR
ncbi:MAG TPA: malonyl-ACP O-methyltransferase BioC [Usitatibacter sp.]|jgi:malonyl-CoA O-methyltransferase|nr:malonyl-ACP O-methyltransferase BioC [Usitatibacter sp.]